MKLYHFTAKHLLDSILKEGLTKGGLPIIEQDKVSFLTPLQWLTINKDFAQTWCSKKELLKYDRNEVRLTIKVPNSELNKNLIKWTDLAKIKGYDKVATYLNDKEGDFNNWYVYAGKIKKHWIREIVYNTDPAKG